MQELIEDPEQEILDLVDTSSMKMIIRNDQDIFRIYNSINEGYFQGNFDLFFENIRLLAGYAEQYSLVFSQDFKFTKIDEILYHIMNDPNIDIFIQKTAFKIIYFLTVESSNGFCPIFSTDIFLILYKNIFEEGNPKKLKYILKILNNLASNTEVACKFIIEEIRLPSIITLMLKKNQKSEFIGLSARLLYSLLTNAQVNEIQLLIDASAFLIMKEDINISSWGLWILCKCCTSNEFASSILQIPNFVEYLTNYIIMPNQFIQQPALTLLLQIHTFIDDAIDGFDYRILIDFLDPSKEDNFEFSDIVASIFANIMTNPAATEKFISEGYLIFLIEAFTTGKIKTQECVIDAVFNAIQTVPKHLIHKFLKDNIFEVLIPAMEISNSGVLAKILSILLTILPIPEFLTEFTQNIEEDSFSIIAEDESESVEILYNKFLENYPQFAPQD